MNRRIRAERRMGIIDGLLEDGRLTIEEQRVLLANIPLAGRAEVADLLGVASQNVGVTAGIPEPEVTYLKRGDLWLADEAQAFAKDRKAVSPSS